MVNKKDLSDQEENESQEKHQNLFLKQKKEIIGDLMTAGLRPSKFIFAREEDQIEI